MSNTAHRGARERRSVSGFTVDGPASRDLDDAVLVARTDAGYLVEAHIADVASAVPAGSIPDAGARQRGSTRYRAAGSRPMLPRSISEGAVSLLPDRVRLTVTIRAEYDDQLQRTRVEVEPTRFRNEARLAFADIPSIVRSPDHPLAASVRTAVEFAERMLSARRGRGALALYDLNCGWTLTDDGAVKQLLPHEATVGYVLVQEIMIAANTALADFAREREVPVLYRNHQPLGDAPDREAILSALADALRGPIDASALRKYVHTALGRAEYSARCLGHYGLNLAAYAHATSPIRRYADLVTQRQILAAAAGEQYPYSADQLEEIADHLNRLAEEERDVRSAAEKLRADARAERAAGGEQIAQLGDSSFERVLKVAIRGGAAPAPALQREYLSRLGGGRLPELHLYLVLIETETRAEWQQLRDATADYIWQNAHLAPTIANIASATLGWPDFQCEVASTGPAHARFFTATASLGDQASGAGTGSTAKQAKYRALAALLARRALSPVPACPAAPESVTGTRAVPVPADSGGSPVAALQEYAQKCAVAPPEYRFARATGSADHSPIFTATCVFGDREAAGSGSATKQSAKTSAASAMLRLLKNKASE